MKTLVLASSTHQYVRRNDAQVVTEAMLGDWMVNFLYSRARERTGVRVSQLLAHVDFDRPLTARLVGHNNPTMDRSRRVIAPADP
jgi:hypothetical protein